MSNNLITIRSVLQQLYPTIKSKYEVKSLHIFGSYLHGKQTQNSDIDILVTFTSKPDLFTFIELENFLTDKLGIKVDLVMQDSLKPNIGKRILSEARLI
jgi:hypothetical protein